MIPICVNCAHWDKSNLGLHYCRRPIGTKANLVTGVQTVRLFFSASSERKKPWFFGKERCGPDGKFYVRKPDLLPPSSGGSGVKPRIMKLGD